MRVESNPRKRGRTRNGPLPTGITLTSEASASPVDNGFDCSIAASEMVSTCSGIRRTSRSARLVVTVIAALNTPTSSANGTSRSASSVSTITVRAASENPGRETITR